MSVVGIMIPANVRIIASYVVPNQLENLFSDNGFDFDMKFKYDMSTMKGGWEEISYVVRRFPNIVLIGLAIKCDRGDLCILEIMRAIGIDKCVYVRKLMLEGNDVLNCVVNLFGLGKCCNLRVMRAKKCTISNVNVLEELLFVRHIDLWMCCTHYELETKMFTKIKYFCGPFYIPKFRNMLYKMPKLRHLNGWEMGFYGMNEGLPVKSFVLHNNRYIPNFSTWYNLEFLCIIRDKYLMTDEIVCESSNMRCLKLNHIMIVGYDNMDLGFFNGCENLMIVEMHSCRYVKNIELMRRKGIIVMINGLHFRKEGYKYMKLYGDFIRSCM